MLEVPWLRHSVYLQFIDHPQYNLERWAPSGRGVRSRRYKYFERAGGRTLIFDMDKDPNEKIKDLSQRDGDAAVMEEHRRELLARAARTDDPWPESAMEGLIYCVSDNVFGEFQALGREGGSGDNPVYDAGRRRRKI